MKVSKDVKKMRYYESTLLTAYKVCASIYFHFFMESLLMVLEIGMKLFSKTLSEIKISENFQISTPLNQVLFIHLWHVIKSLRDIIYEVHHFDIRPHFFWASLSTDVLGI